MDDFSFVLNWADVKLTQLKFDYFNRCQRIDKVYTFIKLHPEYAEWEFQCNERYPDERDKEKELTLFYLTKPDNTERVFIQFAAGGSVRIVLDVNSNRDRLNWDRSKKCPSGRWETVNILDIDQVAYL